MKHKANRDILLKFFYGLPMFLSPSLSTLFPLLNSRYLKDINEDGIKLTYVVNISHGIVLA
jgi:hypothetical protein